MHRGMEFGVIAHKKLHACIDYLCAHAYIFHMDATDSAHQARTAPLFKNQVAPTARSVESARAEGSTPTGAVEIPVACPFDEWAFGRVNAQADAHRGCGAETVGNASLPENSSPIVS